MHTEPRTIGAALARAWRSIVKAFTPAPDASGSQQYGTDTTLFGGSTELPRDRNAPGRATSEFWADTTDFAEMDAERDSPRRR